MTDFREVSERYNVLNDHFDLLESWFTKANYCERAISTELYILDTIFENINCVEVWIPVIALP